MTKKKDDNQIKYFIEDANLFSLWFFSSPGYYPKSYLGMDDISPFDSWDYNTVFDFLKVRLEIAGVAFPKIDCYNDIPDEELKPLSIENLKKHNAEVRKAVRRFLNNDFGVKEVEILSSVFHNIYRWVYFQPNFTKDDIQKLLKQVDEYIDKFLNNELFVYDRNYLTFEKQKQSFIELVRKMSALEKYGENFVISNEESDRITNNDGFLFVHTLYALKKLGYITVLRIWCERNGLYNKRTYYANIVAFDKLIDEANNSYKKENPQTIFEGYDEKHNMLKFAGKAIELSKKNKETDAVLLLKTLIKDPDRYWFNDEVADDWDIATGDEASKNKVYFAARKINEAVKMETGVDDFIDHNTKKFRINPKYLKS